MGERNGGVGEVGEREGKGREERGGEGVGGNGRL